MIVWIEYCCLTERIKTTMTTELQKKILRPYGKWLDIILLAWVLTFLLMTAGQELGHLVLKIPAADSALDSLTGDADTTAFLNMYLDFFGIWIVGLAVFFCYRPDRPMFKAIGHNRRGNTLRMGLLGLLIGFGLNGLCILLSVISGDIKLTFQGMDPLLLAVFLAAVLIQSSGEELVNRCFLYQKLRRRYRHPAVAILGNSLLFGIIHMTNPGASLGGLLQVIIAGLLFSLIIYYYGSFWAACGFHTGWNFTQSILFGLPNSGYVSNASVFRLDAASATDGPFYTVGFGVESSPGAIILMGILCVVAIVIGRRMNQREDLWREASRAYETV